LFKAVGNNQFVMGDTVTPATAAPVATAPTKSVPSDFTMHPLWLSFASREDEAGFQRKRLGDGWLAVRSALVLLVALVFLTGTDNFNRSTSMVILLAGRLLPLVALFVFSALGVAARPLLWSWLAAAAVAVSVSCLHLIHHLCSTTTDDLALHMWSCDAIVAHGVPWLSTTLAATVPFLLTQGLLATWWSAVLSGLCCVATYLGFVVPHIRAAERGAAVAVPILIFALAVWATYFAERDLRRAHKGVVSSERKLSSAVGAGISKTVAREQSQRLSQVLKRAPLLMYEVSGDGLIQYASPSFSTVLGAYVYRFVGGVCRCLLWLRVVSCL
jgi:hypothetical protein